MMPGESTGTAPGGATSAGFVVPPGVAVVEVDDVVYVAHVPEGPIRVLADTAALIWHELLTGDPDTVAQRVAESWGVGLAEVEPSVAVFTAELVRAGLLAES